jgi:hypothetical protein
MRLCSIEGCGDRHDAKGFCKKHYLRWVRHILRRPHGEVFRHRPFSDRTYWAEWLRNHSTFKADTCCWDFNGAKNWNGYGEVRTKLQGRIRAHRLSYQTYIGDLDPDLMVLHLCHRPICIAPWHLQLDTHQENMRQMVAANRHVHGERAHSAKLTEEEVAEIKALYGSQTCKAMGDQFGVSAATVCLIGNGQRWKYSGIP